MEVKLSNFVKSVKGRLYIFVIPISCASNDQEIHIPEKFVPEFENRQQIFRGVFFIVTRFVLLYLPLAFSWLAFRIVEEKLPR